MNVRRTSQKRNEQTVIVPYQHASMQSKSMTSRHEKITRSISESKILGWQDALSVGDLSLYNITPTKDLSFVSTVSNEDHRVMNLPVTNGPFSRRPAKKLRNSVRKKK